MYDLNYTYLTELEVDTRQAFSDISDDLLLVDNSVNKKSETFDMKTLVSSWQDFFWKSNNSNKKELHVTFTDLSIEHLNSSPFDGINYPQDFDGNTVDMNEMMTYEELSAFFQYLDTPTAEGSTGKWADNKKNFSDLCVSLLDAIDILHEKMQINKLYPIGSIVVNDTNPGSVINTQTWASRKQAYISENLRNQLSGTELSSTGYHAGKTINNQPIGSKLGSATMKPDLKQNGLVPKHDHKLAFSPTSGRGGTTTTTAAGPFVTYTNLRQGNDGDPGSGQVTSGYIDFTNEARALAVGEGASNPRVKDGYGIPEFPVSETNIPPTINSINVAPRTYPLSATIWERTS